MKEDQTQLITGRLEHLRFLMESGKMPIFRHRSDMFLFALEAHNIARGLSSRYYRLQEDMDIRFFVRFPFDYWLGQLQQWIEQLNGAEYRVEDTDFFAEGRAKRLTIVVDRLFGYHTDQLPEDSAHGSMPLPDEEILEPFRKIMQMRSTDLVTSYRNALQEVYNYLDRLSTMPLDWTDEKRREALRLYFADASKTGQVKHALADYKYFCRMPQGKSVQGQFCHLKELLASLTAHDELKGLSLSKREQEQLLSKLQKLFGKEETHPAQDQIPENAKPMAGDELLAKFLYFVNFTADRRFPVLDEDKVFNYLIRKDVVLNLEQEQNLQTLFALMGAMKEWYAPVLATRSCSSKLGNERQERIEKVLAEVKKLNAKLTTMLDYKRTTDEIDAFFNGLFSTKWLDEYTEAQDDLLKLFEKDRTEINLKPYVRMLRVANDALLFFKPATSYGKKIYACLKDEPIMRDVTDGETIQSYWSKQGYGVNIEDKWEEAVLLVDAVKKEYKQS
jgi:hypothetical protein